MLKKIKVLLSCVIVLTLALSFTLPCFGATADIEDTVAVDSIFYSANSDYSNLKKNSELSFSQGLTDSNATSFGAKGIFPNYFISEFRVSSTTGLPLFTAGQTYSFTISNFYNYIDSMGQGDGYLSSINMCGLNLWYNSSEYSGFDYNVKYNYFYNADNTLSSVTFTFTPIRDVTHFYYRLYYDVTDFGLDFWDNETDLYEVIFYIGSVNFQMSSEEVFVKPDSKPITDYHDAESALIDSTSGGKTDASDAIGSLENSFSTGSSLYKGALFWGNMMTGIVDEIPILNDIILVSLALGIVMLILGFSLEIGGRISRNRQKAQNRQNGKGG